MSNIHGISSIRRPARGDGGEQKNGDDNTEEFSVGGAASATAVLRPTNGPGREPNPLAEIVNRARATVPGGDAESRNLGIITVYSNGFIIGADGEFRPIAVRQNADFIAELKRGEVPAELEAQCRREWGDDAAGDVAIQIVDKSAEEYKPKFSFASSRGQSLSSSSANAATAVHFADIAPAAYVADTSRPVTSIQIVLPNRTRVKGTFNVDATVAQLYAHILTLVSASAVELVAGFPPKPLSDPHTTIKDAGLSGSQVSVRQR